MTTPGTFSTEPTSAPAASRLPLFVLLLGLATSGLALFGVYYAEANYQENLMGIYADYVLPVGAVMVGLVAASGYGLASYFSGVKIRRGLLALIIIVQFGAYVAAQYLEFRSHGALVHADTLQPVTFFEYYHVNTVNMGWKEEHHTSSSTAEESKPLGWVGYLVRLGEVIGFVGGSVIVPACLMAAPYCDTCQFYMKKKILTTIPASAPSSFKQKVSGKTPQVNEEAAKLIASGRETLDRLQEVATSGDAETFRGELAALAPGAKKATQLPHRFEIAMVRCKLCSQGHLRVSMLSGHGKHQKRQKMPNVDLAPEFVRSFTGET